MRGSSLRWLIGGLWAIAGGRGVAASALTVSQTTTEWYGAQSDVLLAIVGKEIAEVETYVKQLEHKANVLEQMVERMQLHVGPSEQNASSNDSTRNPRGRPNHRRGTQKRTHFKQWLAPLPAWTPEHPPGCTEKDPVETRLLSFQSNSHSQAPKARTARSYEHVGVLAPNLQFLMRMDKSSGTLDLYDPRSRALLWQHRVSIRAPIAKVFFHSERANHLGVVTVAGDVIMYKIRVYHGRRLVSGDYRRPGAVDSLQCTYTFTCPRDLAVGWWDTISGFPRTMPPVGARLHLDFEVVFRLHLRSLPIQLIVTHHRHFVHMLVSDERGQLALYHGTNGSFIHALPKMHAPITQLHVVGVGVVAFTVQNRIQFFDILTRQVVSLTCEGSMHSITSIDSDPWRSSVLYAGTSDSRGLVFQIKNFNEARRSTVEPFSVDKYSTTHDSNRPMPTCQLIAQLLPRKGRSGGKALVKVVPGYVFLVTNATVAIYDITTQTTAPTYLTETTRSPSLSASTQLVSAWTAQDVHNNPIALAVVLKTIHPNGTSSPLRMELFASLLPPPVSRMDLGWLRTPLVLICAIGMACWQQARPRPARGGVDPHLDAIVKKLGL